MKGTLQKIVATACCTIGCVLLCGCEEANTSDVKMHRLIAAENSQLRAQLQAETQKRDKEIKDLKDQLGQCEQEKQVWQDKADKALKEQIDGMIGIVMDEANNLKQENENLKARIKELEGQTGPSPAKEKPQ